MKEYLFSVTYSDVMTCLTGISKKFHSDLRKINSDKVVFEDLLLTTAKEVPIITVEDLNDNRCIRSGIWGSKESIYCGWELIYEVVDCGYEVTIANNCRYHLGNQNIFEPKKLRYLQQIQIINCLQRPATTILYRTLPNCQIVPYHQFDNRKIDL